MKFWFLVFLVMCGQVASTQDRKAAQAFEGCYELRVEGRQPLLNYGNQFLPKRFQLKAERVNGGYAVKNLDSKVRWDLPLSSWRLKGEQGVEITWSTGYVGWDIQLSSFGAEGRGTARFFTDTGSDSRPKAVVTHTVECGDSSPKS